jgi:stringent starvation protein B
MPIGVDGTPTRPYLLRALHDWCTDNGFTPYLAVQVGPGVRVPMEYVKNNEIVLNCGFEATTGLKLGNEFIEFKARFGGVARDIIVPVDHVVAIYARENGQGMAFPMPTAAAEGALVPLPLSPPSGASNGAAASGPAAGPGLRLARGGDEAAPVSLSAGVAPSLAPALAPAPAPALVEANRPERPPSSPAATEPQPPIDPTPPSPRPALKRVK